MIGTCPNCSIHLKEEPFTSRETNEVMITLRYRNFIDNNLKLLSIEKKGYCEICDAKLEDLENQKKALAN